MTTKKKTSKGIFIVGWVDNTKKRGDITFRICNDSNEAIKTIRQKYTLGGIDDFRVYKVKVGQSPKLACYDELKNYASQSALAKI